MDVFYALYINFHSFIHTLLPLRPCATQPQAKEPNKEPSYLLLNGQEQLSVVGVFLDDGLEFPPNVVGHGPGQQGHPPFSHLCGLLHKGCCHLVEQAHVQRVLGKGSRKEFRNGLSLQVQMMWRYTHLCMEVTTITIYFIHPSGKLKLSFDRTTKNISH